MSPIKKKHKKRRILSCSSLSQKQEIISSLINSFTQSNKDMKPFEPLTVRIPNSKIKEKMKLNKEKLKILTKQTTRKFSKEPCWKQTLRGKLYNLSTKNLVINEKKFNPSNYTENILVKKIPTFTNRFHYMDRRKKVGIYTNAKPTILENNNNFYCRFFDNFISPDELLYKNFKEKEIIQIKSDPAYFHFGNNYSKNVGFFKRRKLVTALNEEEIYGIDEVIKKRLDNSLKKTKEKINDYLNYYTTTLSKNSKY